jgi:uncharacterized repeat protein (TIGR01451 family)
MRGLLVSRCVRRMVLGGVVGMIGLLGVGGVAFAVTPAPAWKVTTVAAPTVVPAGPGENAVYYVVVENVGGAPSEGEVRIKDVLPAGISVINIRGEKGSVSGQFGGESLECEAQGTGEAGCHFSTPVVSSGFVVMYIEASASVSVGDVLTNTASVAGGGAAPVSRVTSTRAGVEGETGGPGVSEFAFNMTGPAGEPLQQAGGHPTLMTSTVLFNNTIVHAPYQSGGVVWSIGDVDNLVFYLPLGFLGDPQVAVRCPASLANTGGFTGGKCPPGSRVGTVLSMIIGEASADKDNPTGEDVIYNVAPEKGYAAEFIFEDSGFLFDLYASVVRHDGAYMLRVSAPGLPRFTHLFGVIASIYGDSRESYSDSDGEEVSRDLGAFLTDPSACSSEPLDASVEFNTWQDQGSLVSQSAPAFAGIEGCGQQRFSTALSARAASTQADEPSGYTIGLEVPQAPDGFTGLATPPAKSVSVTLPTGTSLSPAGANGLGSCQETGGDRYRRCGI